MASSEGGDRRQEKACQADLSRNSLIQDLLDQELTTREQGCLAREVAR
ncbi:hypothetical protein ACFU6I_36000 [Streptomyces sp. NPDC057486]